MSNGSKGWWARHIDTVYRLVLLALIMLWAVYPPHASESGNGAPPLLLTAATKP